MRWIVLVAALTWSAAALGHGPGIWEESSHEVLDWMSRLMQPDNPTIPCCGKADVYEADHFEVEGDHYVAIITDGAGDAEMEKPAIPNGTRILVPNNKIKWDKGNPTGHGIIFIGKTGVVFCYLPPVQM